MKKVLVLGATGFIGGHIAKAAMEEHWHVRGFRRHPESSGHLAGQPVQWLSGDLMDKPSLLAAMDDCDIVFHAAAFYPKSGNPKLIPAYMKQAQKEIDCVLESAIESKIKRFIYTSTLTTIGKVTESNRTLANETDFYTMGSNSYSAYAETKALMENSVMLAARRDLDAVILNPTAVLGPGDVHLTLGKLLIATSKGYLKGYVPATVNIVDVRDVARAHIQAVKSGRRGERYIIGGQNYSLKDALTIAAKTMGVPPPKYKIPSALIELLVFIGDRFPSLPLPANHLRMVNDWQGYEIQKAIDQLELNITPLEITVRDAMKWFGDYGFLD